MLQHVHKGFGDLGPEAQKLLAHFDAQMPPKSLGKTPSLQTKKVRNVNDMMKRQGFLPKP